MDPEAGIRVAILTAAFFTIFFFLIASVLYVIGSIGLYRIAQKNEVEHSWFSFIPILQFYILGKLIGEIKVGSHIIPELELLLSIGFFAKFIPIFGLMLKILWTVILLMTLYELYKLYKGDKATGMIFISIITLGLAIPIFLFSMRNDEPLKKIEQVKVE